MTELLLGCGFQRQKLMGLPGSDLVWKQLVTLDINKKCKPDYVCDLNAERWFPFALTGDDLIAKDEFPDDSFDEIHAYEVLEHLGEQGYASTFFNTFRNLHRILRNGGHLFATVPSRYSPWLWGDPSHRRAILKESLTFLSQEMVKANRERGTPMSDFSHLWDRDFKIVSSQDNHQFHMFCLQAIK